MKLRALALVAVALLAFAPGAAFAAATVQEMSAVGAMFTCQGGVTYTVTSGTVRIAFNETTSASGNMSVTGTIVPQNVVAVSSTGGTFRIVGADWFGGSLNAQNGNMVFTDTEHFQILGPRGPVASVAQTFHISSNSTVTLDKGTCEPPPD